MSENLQEITTEVSQLELHVMTELIERAPLSDMRYLELPKTVSKYFQIQLNKLFDRLYHSGASGSLTLVTEEHDDLRIRLIYLRNLILRDIPIPYLEQAHADMETPVARRAAAQPVVEAVRERPGVMQRMLGALLKRSGEQPPAQRPPQNVTVTRAEPAPTLPSTIPEQAFRVLLLHQIMEEDRQKLMKKGQELPRATERIRLPEPVREMVIRTLNTERIARSPEELRRKLEERARKNAGAEWGGAGDGPSRFTGQDRAEAHFATRPAPAAKPGAEEKGEG